MDPLSPSVSVIVCAAATQSWESLYAALRAVQRQSLPAMEIILVVDHNSFLLERARASFPNLRVMENSDVRGMTGARHTGLEAARGRIMAFLEGEEIASPNWLTELVSVYTSPHTPRTRHTGLADIIAARHPLP